jgi:Polyketide cyclase / dehydrase and lipid transport
VVARQPHVLYDLISDVTRMSEWSVVSKECWWDEGSSPHVGAWFTARNEIPNRTGDTRSQWERRCEVTVANRGREFTYVVAGSWIQWSFTFVDASGGTRVTETGRFLPQGIVSFHERFGDDADAEIAKRIETARQGVAEALAGIKRVAEAE